MFDRKRQRGQSRRLSFPDEEMVMNRKSLKTLAVGTMVAAVPIGLVAVVAPAEATTTRAHCSVTPLIPRWDGWNSSSQKMVRYSVDVSCEKGRSILIHQARWEEDDGGHYGRGDD